MLNYSKNRLLLSDANKLKCKFNAEVTLIKNRLQQNRVLQAENKMLKQP